MSQPVNQNIRHVLQISRDMLELADAGDRDRQDTSCGIMYGVLRDMAYRLRKLAETECEAHKNADKWD